MLNAFRIQLATLEGDRPEFGIRFLSSNSPFSMQENGGRPLIQDQVAIPDSGGVTFLPDGVFSITHRGRQKTLLFFLEVDMGTESLTTNRGGGKDIRQKIITYQWYFRTGGYRRYEQIFGTQFKGFRLLFLTNTTSRLAAPVSPGHQHGPDRFHLVD